MDPKLLGWKNAEPPEEDTDVGIVPPDASIQPPKEDAELPEEDTKPQENAEPPEEDADAGIQPPGEDAEPPEEHTKPPEDTVKSYQQVHYEIMLDSQFSKHFKIFEFHCTNVNKMFQDESKGQYLCCTNESYHSYQINETCKPKRSMSKNYSYFCRSCTNANISSGKNIIEESLHYSDRIYPIYIFIHSWHFTEILIKKDIYNCAV